MVFLTVVKGWVASKMCFIELKAVNWGATFCFTQKHGSKRLFINIRKILLTLLDSPGITTKD